MDYVAKIYRGIGVHFRPDPDTTPEIRVIIINKAWKIKDSVYFFSKLLLYKSDITLNCKCKMIGKL